MLRTQHLSKNKVFRHSRAGGNLGVGYGLGILFLSSGAKQSLLDKEIASSPPAPRNDMYSYFLDSL